MSLKEELYKGTNNILNSKWSFRKSNEVPNTDNVLLSGGAVHIDGTILYADLALSSKLISDFQQRTAAKIIKLFIFCCSKIITCYEGEITSFDGDRVMGLFLGKSKNTNAVKSALIINYTVQKIIRPSVAAYFISMRKTRYKIRHAVGIDSSPILTIRAGQRGSNDLVWIGRAPNLAAKLCSLREPEYQSYISDTVYSKMHKSLKIYNKSLKPNMWKRKIIKWNDQLIKIYRSSYIHEP